MGDIYNYGKERFGVSEKRKEQQQREEIRSRRPQEIDKLIQERRQLKRQWRKATEDEKIGIDCLQVDAKEGLAVLSRAGKIAGILGEIGTGKSELDWHFMKTHLNLLSRYLIRRRVVALWCLNRNLRSTWRRCSKIRKGWFFCLISHLLEKLVVREMTAHQGGKRFRE